MTNSAMTVTAPNGFIGVGVSEYLNSRSFDGDLVESILDAVKPIIDAHNASAECLSSLVEFRVSMSAKHQTLTAKIESYESDVNVEKFDDLIGRVESVISDVLDEEIVFENSCSGTYALAAIE